jgi:hypothetical protein
MVGRLTVSDALVRPAGIVPGGDAKSSGILGVGLVWIGLRRLRR